MVDQGTLLSWTIDCTNLYYIWMFPKMVVPNNHGFPTKMIILGCFGGTTIYGNTHIVFVYMSSLTGKIASPTFWQNPNSNGEFGWPKKCQIRRNCPKRWRRNVCFLLKLVAINRNYYKYETLWISLGGNVTRSNLIKSVPCKSKAIKNKSPLELLIINPY